ncbi:MAG: 30S ribosome-binding factor RbfA [Deltaproteobacteria bacterium]|jgi:ribosome-binding factor A|nr:30S ribosome-binding factor RbfA [Deltaproteobacteria bacterium]
MKNKRQDKLASLLEGFVANLLLTRAADPRLQKVNITRSKLSPDLKSATIFYSVLGLEPLEDAPDDLEKALQKATGFIRSQIALELKLRAVPKVRFIFDRNPGHAQRISELLESEEVKSDLAKVPEEPLEEDAAQDHLGPQASKHP